MIDAADDLAAFVSAFPAWVDSTGHPLSWRHVQVGLAQMNRAKARDALQTFGAVGMTHAKEDDQRAWLAHLRLAAGYQ